MTTNTRSIIDYAAQDDGSNMRDALYNDIATRVNAHMDSYKQEIAKTLIAPEEEQEEVGTEE